ncbi:hypothetical protein BBFGKLBO_00496 [Synechococcus sp. CBW1107]|jgi:hypothetical protein|nr:hypothetical protein BBFGKLBO_00496 [Synechococcus sp. CBW1107]
MERWRSSPNHVETVPGAALLAVSPGVTALERVDGGGSVVGNTDDGVLAVLERQARHDHAEGTGRGYF